MRILNRHEISFMETLIQSDEKSTMSLVNDLLKKYYDKVELTLDYIYAEGNIPVALVAHMDTVFEKDTLYSQRELFYDRIKNTMWCDKGAGFDDKAGIYAIFQILKSGLRPHVIFTTDEEKGCVGATALAATAMPFKELKYVIQLDRRGVNDCVFYDCENPDFTKYVEGFGFTEAIGSFSDISEICPAWKVAGVNLSVGYKNEHSTCETLYVPALLSTIDKVKRMLSETDIPHFKYIPSRYGGFGWGKYSSYYDYPYGKDYDYPGWDEDPYPNGIIATNEKVICEFCGKELEAKDAMPFQNLKGKYRFCCDDCISNHISWCDLCNDAFEIDPADPDNELCPQCFREIVNDEKYNY